MGKFVDLSGKRFGLLSVISKHGRNACNQITWLCKCDCGNLHIVSGSNLKSGSIQSCGCIRRERAKVHMKSIQRREKIHGMEPKKLYSTWCNMKSRCNNPKNQDFHNYGARGIKVCPEWESNFISFRDWSFANGYDDALTIDRIDGNKGYSPENCRWVNLVVQANNTRRNRLLTHNGETKTMAEWARILGVTQAAIKWKVRNGESEF